MAEESFTAWKTWLASIFNEMFRLMHNQERDNFDNFRYPERIDLIKLDIEGSELGALRGAEKSLRRWRPKLAISLYHRPEDFFAIPLWLKSLDCGYRFYLDHYSIHHEETVLYGTSDAG